MGQPKLDEEYFQVWGGGGGDKFNSVGLDHWFSALRMSTLRQLVTWPTSASSDFSLKSGSVRSCAAFLRLRGFPTNEYYKLASNQGRSPAGLP